MNKIVDIVNSWVRIFNHTEEQGKVAAKRAEICFSCEHIKKSDIADTCGKCGCPIRSKVFSTNGCPVNKW